MCLILFSHNDHPDYRLILAANRDEYYNRPTQPLSFWQDAPSILAGRDLKSKGTWLGVSRSSKIAAVTNFRDPASQKENAPSRGLLVSNFLAGKESPKSYLAQVKTIGHLYNGFNLIVGNGSELYYYSNRGGDFQRMESGLHGISNHLLDTPWPKLEKGKADFQTMLAGKKINIENIFSILGDRSYPPDDKLPDTGVGLERERLLSSIFITSKDYGTHSSSIVLMKRTGEITFIERTFVSEGARAVNPETRKLKLPAAS